MERMLLCVFLFWLCYQHIAWPWDTCLIATIDLWPGWFTYSVSFDPHTYPVMSIASWQYRWQSSFQGEPRFIPIVSAYLFTSSFYPQECPCLDDILNWCDEKCDRHNWASSEGRFDPRLLMAKAHTHNSIFSLVKLFHCFFVYK